MTRGGSTSLEAELAPAMAQAARGPWPLVGRAGEVALLKQSIAGRRGAVIRGAAGAGKTALAMVGVEFARSERMAIAIAAGTEAARSHPFGAFASLLHQEDDPFGPAESHAEMLRRHTRELLTDAGRQPLLVFVDDAHLLDDGTTMLVHQLVRTGEATVVTCVASSGPSGRPLPDPMVVLWKDLGASRIELEALDGEAVEDLLLAVLGGPVEDASTRRLMARSLGDPMFLRELVTGAIAQGTLREESGVWRLTAPLQPTPRLNELVTERLGDLTTDERHVLELTALGEPLTHPMLGVLANDIAISSLEERGILASRMDGRRLQISLAHPLFADVARMGMTPRRVREMSRSLADKAGSRRHDDALLIASLRLAGGGGSAELLLAGARAARQLGDPELTERMARAATERGDDFESRLLAAEAAHRRGRHEQGARELDALAGAARGPSERVRVALFRFDHALFLEGDADLAPLDALFPVVEEPAWREELVARRLRLVSMRDGPGLVVASLPVPDPSGPHTALQLVAGETLCRSGSSGEALRILAAAEEVSPRLDTWPEPWSNSCDRALALVALGRLDEAEDELTEAHRELAAAPGSLASAAAAAAHGALHLEQGRVQSAFMQATSAAATFMELGQPVSARRCHAVSAHALALTGAVSRATEALTALESLDLPPDMCCEVDVLHARAWVSVATGDMGTARHHLEAAATLGLEVGDLLGASKAFHSLARIGRAREVADQFGDLAPQVDGDLTAARLAHCSAAATRDSDALDAAAARFEDLGTLLYAAEARGESAVQRRRAGAARDAAAAERAAAGLLGLCEGAMTPPVRAIGARTHLTPAELDTALQAAAGSSDKEIADAMHLSVRTVENRLHRTYQKLGLSHRGELADALRELPTA